MVDRLGCADAVLWVGRGVADGDLEWDAVGDGLAGAGERCTTSWAGTEAPPARVGSTKAITTAAVTTASASGAAHHSREGCGVSPSPVLIAPR